MLIIDIEEQLENTREQMREHRARLEALENGETYIPSLTSKPSVNSKKRKNTSKSKQGPSKRKRSVATEDEEDELMESDENFSDNSSSDMEDDDDDDDDDDDNDENSNVSDEDPVSSQIEEEMAELTLTEDDLKEKIQEAKDAIKSGREMLSNARIARKEAIDNLSSVEKGSVKIQREKNAFCSLKRSEVSKNSLINDTLAE